MTGTWVDDRLGELVIAIHPAMLAEHEVKARRRLGPRGQPDWPVLAATYAADASAWSHDKDLFGGGAPVRSTKTLMNGWNGRDADGSSISGKPTIAIGKI